MDIEKLKIWLELQITKEKEMELEERSKKQWDIMRYHENTRQAFESVLDRIEVEEIYTDCFKGE